MLKAAQRLTLTFLVLAIQVARAQSLPSAIRGTLNENGAPITEATVFLQSLDDKKCAELFTRKNPGNKVVEKLERCVHDVGTAAPDSTGRYQFVARKRAGMSCIFSGISAKNQVRPRP